MVRRPPATKQRLPSLKQKKIIIKKLLNIIDSTSLSSDEIPGRMTVRVTVSC